MQYLILKIANDIVLASYLKRNCGAIVETQKDCRKIYLKEKAILRVFSSKESFKSFVNHSGAMILKIYKSEVNLNKLPRLLAAELIFGKNAEAIT